MEKRGDRVLLDRYGGDDGRPIRASARSSLLHEYEELMTMLPLLDEYTEG